MALNIDMPCMLTVDENNPENPAHQVYGRPALGHGIETFKFTVMPRQKSPHTTRVASPGHSALYAGGDSASVLVVKGWLETPIAVHSRLSLSSPGRDTSGKQTGGIPGRPLGDGVYAHCRGYCREPGSNV